MDKNFAIDVSGCSQEQVKEMADWLCERFGVKVLGVDASLYNEGDRYNHLLIDDRGLYVSYLDASYWLDKDFFTYKEALEIMKKEQKEYKEQSAHKADIAMGEAIDTMDKTGHDIRDAVCINHFPDIKKSFNDTLSSSHQAWSFLEAGVKNMKDRASERDQDNGERSMLSTVNAFNAMYGKDLTEEQGWMFMVFLKASRAKGGAFRQDDYADGATYFALAGESAAKDRKCKAEDQA